VTRASAARALLSIGDVLSQLREEFPDVTISKIRFLEQIGLVEPERTASNYRKFSANDVDRLRYILSAQRDRYLPLKRIREELEAMDSGEQAAPPRLGGPHSAPPTDALPTAETFARDGIRTRLSRSELIERAGVPDEALTAMESYGLVAPRPGTTHYDDDALAVAEAVGRLADFGLEARHLRGFKTAADREVGLVQQLVTPLRSQRSTDARARADEVVRELAAGCVRLHAALVRAGLRR
jgi:DNA-binding transcriptional MerR regulator